MARACDGVLTCDAEWAARLTGPGGYPVLLDLTDYVLSGKIERKLDATSAASVIIGRDDQACCRQIADLLGGWGCAELEVWRDGEIAWAGPVTVPQWGYAAVAISAEDNSAWWKRRVIREDHRWVGADIATIFADVHAAAMAAEPVWGFNISPTATGIAATRTVLAKDTKYAAEVLNELARTGIDWTVHGRAVLVGGETLDLAPIATLRDEDWIGETAPVLEWAGDFYASRVIVRGANNLIGVAELSDADQPCGLVERVFTEESIEDQSSLDAAARNRLAALRSPWRLLSDAGAVLRCGSPVEFADLVPGARVRVQTDIPCSPLTIDFRLESVTANYGESDVQVTLTQMGTSYSKEND